MDRKQLGFIDFSTMTLLIGGLALFGLLVYGAQSGHELPLWPAVIVTLVNIVAAAKIVLATKNAKKQSTPSASQPPR